MRTQRGGRPQVSGPGKKNLELAGNRLRVMTVCVRVRDAHDGYHSRFSGDDEDVHPGKLLGRQRFYH